MTYRHDGVGFTHDKRRGLFVVDLPRDPEVRCVLPASDADGPAARQVAAGDVDLTSLAWLPDGRHVVAVAARHAARNEDCGRHRTVAARAGHGPVGS